MPPSPSSTARIFLSSTFRDFVEERELLVKRVFPALRARLRERFVELVDVDLRWGILPEASERGEVLPICLAEIDRARPWFIGMLGERYGWIPPAHSFSSDLIQQQPWLDQYQGGKSVTELEILHGVLNDPAMAGRALFYFRDPAYAKAKGGDYVSNSDVDAARLGDLKDQIRASGFAVIEDYLTPEALADRLEADLWALLDKAFPLEEVPDAFTAEQRRHQAYALPRRRLYLGAETHLEDLGLAITCGQQRILIEGASGGGKSALVANGLEQHRQRFPNDRVHEYYLGASADAASPTALVRHLIEHIKQVTNTDDEVPSDPSALLDSLSQWFAYASAHANKEGYRWVIALDGLNGLTKMRDLRWLPEFLPEQISLVVSCLPGEVMQALKQKADWQPIELLPLSPDQSRTLLQSFLAQYNKTLSPELEERALAHPLASNPLFLRTLAEELRLFGRHEDLTDELDHYLSSITVDDLFERVLERIERDCGTVQVKAALTAIWASRAGLVEDEILQIAKLVPATWAPIRLALDEALLESAGRITFGHDYLRIAVSDRYMAGNNELADDNQSPEALKLRKKAHENLAKWFSKQPLDRRIVEELPWQWQQAKTWPRLRACMTDRSTFEVMLEHRSNEDLLRYWLDIEAHSKTKLEQAYQTAWNQWAPDQSKYETSLLAKDLSDFLRHAGRHKHPLALQLAQTALTIAEKSVGRDHLDTAIRLNTLALIHLDRGELRAAERFSRRGLVIVEKSLGPEHPDTGTCLSNLAIILADMSDYQAAEPLARRALEIAQKSQGLEHRNTLFALNNLASLLHVIELHDDADQLYRQALAIAERIYGVEHPVTGTILRNFATLLMDRGDHQGSDPLIRRALAIAEMTEGPEHPSTGCCLDTLASLLKVLGDYQAAEPLFRRALAISEKAEGPEHPSTGESLNKLAALLQEMGDYQAAEPLCRRALAISETTNGPEHLSTAHCLDTLALILSDMDDHPAAEPFARRALQIAEEKKGAEHADTGLLLHNLALVLEKMGDHQSAEPLYRRALTVTEKALGPEHPNTRICLNNLTKMLDDIGNDQDAELLYRQNIDKVSKIEGDESSSLASSYHRFGIYLREAGKLEAAEAKLKQALEIRQAALSPSPELGQTLSALGKVYALSGEAVKALDCYNRSLAIISSVTNPDEKRMAIVKARIAELG